MRNYASASQHDLKAHTVETTGRKKDEATENIKLIN
jgi:hypothetical protein